MFFYTFIPKLLNMSLTASVVIVLVLLMRVLLKKAPKVISYALWGIVLFRLLCPVTIESNLSLFGFFDTPVKESGAVTSSIEYIPQNIVHTEYPSVVLPVPGVSEMVNNALPEGREQQVADPLEAPMAIATYVWMFGVLGMGVYAGVSYTKLRRKLITASPLRDNIYLADEITSPFVLGLFVPKIYLPSSLLEREQEYIIQHEQHHIHRLDHIMKALAFAALCIHWFNPLVWVAFIMAGKDMEMSCDEAVLKRMGEGVLADYTASLLSLATGKHIIAGMPLAFGEGDTKGRIRNLVNWKKPTFWVVLIAVLTCVILAVGLLTNPMRTRYFPMAGQNIADLEPQRIVDKICNLENLDNGSPLLINESVAHLVHLKKGFEWSHYETMPFYYMKNKKAYTAQLVADKGEYSITESYETSNQDSAFLFQHYLEALKYLPQEQIKEIAPDADEYLIFFLESGAPSSGYEHVITYTNKGISNRDSWVIHLKIQPTHKTESGSYIGNDDEMIHVFYDHIYEEEPADEVLQWFDDYHNANFLWDGRREISLDSFPGVTFRWTPEKVEAVVGEKISPLYSGMPIWSVYFTDLTGDGLPELCSTLSTGSGIVDDRIIIYDYANGVSYSLEDRMEYDYSLTVQNGKLIVKKRAFEFDNMGDIVEIGYLAYVDNTVSIIPIEQSFTNMLSGTTYVPYQCIYMNPLSSYMAFGGDSGCKYIIGENNFVMMNRGNGAINVAISKVESAGTGIEVEKWEWQEFPYTDEEWNALFIPEMSAIKNISTLYDEILYQPLTEKLFLLSVDGDLWLIELKNNKEMGTYLWSIYSLVEESVMGSAKWAHNPYSSSLTPVFQFEFDMEYTEVSAVCEGGSLVEFNYGDKKSGSELTIPSGQSLSWSPLGKDILNQNTQISFTIHTKDGIHRNGVLYIEQESVLEGGAFYTASLVGTGLHLSPDEEGDGGVISLVENTEMVATEE